MEVYTLHVCGVERHLPIIPISPNLSIASFVLLGDVELTEKAAEALAEKLPPGDVLITAEAKGIPLVHALSVKLGLPSYVVARKSVKAYMEEVLGVEVQSITTTEKQMLYLDREDRKKLAGKKVILIDDVISTGKSLEALETLVEKAEGIPVAKAAILAEGEGAGRKDIIYLQELPLF